jgi:acetylornithine deacetylase/succinyl-diaminopimelate desuccinylase-like protein
MIQPDRLLSAAQSVCAGAEEFLRDLVRIPSVNGENPEVGVAERLVAEAERLGLSARRVAADAARPNVLVEWGQSKPGFAFVAHMDTVAPGNPDAWSHPPFSAHVSGRRLFGRGAADNKAGLACGLYTLAMLRDQGWIDPERHRVVIAGVVDEESGASSPLGVRYLLDQGQMNVHGAIYTYTSDIICIGHRGLLRFRVTARGRAVHSGSPAWSRGEDGLNAVTGLADALVRLEKLLVNSSGHPAFPGMRSVLTPGTLINGGEFESMVPACAEALVDVRLLPGLSAEVVLEQAWEILNQVMRERPGLKLELEVKNNLPAALIPTDHALVRAAEYYTQAITGRKWAAEGAGPANEGYMFIGQGIPMLCGFGPGGGNAHSPDEWVDLDSLPQTIAMYGGILIDYLQHVHASV